jgi:hypothetical protein
MPDQGFEDEPQSRIRIVTITFSFDNGKLLKLLGERGEAIRSEDFIKMRKIESEINELKEKELDKLTRPCSAFVTLENEEGYNRAIMLNKISVGDRKSLAVFMPGVKPTNIKQASEPSDIIWENRMLKKRTRRRRKLVVALVMSACLIGSFVLIF